MYLQATGIESSQAEGNRADSLLAISSTKIGASSELMLPQKRSGQKIQFNRVQAGEAKLSSDIANDNKMN